MIEFFKLKNLPKKQRLHKVIKLLEMAESSLVHGMKSELLDEFYLSQLLAVVIEDVGESQKEKILKWKEDKNERSSDSHKRIIINETRHVLYELTGYTPSEWDLIFPLHKQFDGNSLASQSWQQELNDFRRSFFPNLYVYAEDIRTPFNVGSIFRTAESFGVEKIFLSQHCTSPLSPKAKRVAMGSVEYLPWEHATLDALPSLPIIALETGGKDISNFVFPYEGIAVLGNEEFGVSPALLKKADDVVSIPMYGIKASLNVSVAFGILMQKWTEEITKNMRTLINSK